MATRFLVGCISIAALLLSGCGKDPEIAKREYVKSGDRYLAAGKLNEAIIQYQNAIQQDPRFGEARFKLAEARTKNRDIRGAYGEYVRAADLMPANFDAQMKAALMLMLAEKFEDAGSRADAALKIEPDSAEAKILKANALTALKQTDPALILIDEVIKANPTSGLAYTNRGAILGVAGRTKEAEQAYVKAVEVEPTSIPAFTELARFDWRNGKRREAETALKAALALDGRDLTVNRLLAAVYLTTNRPAEAEGPLKVVAQVSKDVPSQVALADYYIDRDRIPDALGILTALETDPKGLVEAKTRKAVILYKKGSKADAYSAVDAALAKDPKNVPALLVKADFLTLEPKLEEALKLAETAVAADGTSASAHFAVGRIRRALGRPESAIAAFNEALRLSPTSLPVQLSLSDAYLETGRPRDTLQFAQSVLSSQPQNPGALLLQARGFMGVGDLSAAEKSTELLVRGYPTVPAVQVQLGDLYRQKGNAAAARAAYERALAVDAANPLALAGLADLDMRAGNASLSRARIEGVIAKEPLSVPHLLLLGRAEAQLHDYPAAERTFRRVLELDPANLEAYKSLGGLYAIQGRIDEAIAEFDRLAERAENPAIAHTLVGTLLESQNKFDLAMKRYEKALSIDANAPIAANNLAWLLTETGGNLDVALQLAQKAKAALPNSAEVADTLGWVYYRKGLFDQSVAMLKDTVAKQPEVAMFQYHLGLSCAKSGDTQLAIKSLDTALKLDPKAAPAGEAQTILKQLRVVGS